MKIKINYVCRFEEVKIPLDKASIDNQAKEHRSVCTNCAGISKKHRFYGIISFCAVGTNAMISVILKELCKTTAVGVTYMV